MLLPSSPWAIGGTGRSNSPCSRISIATAGGNVVDILDRSQQEEQTDGCGGACRRWGQCNSATQAQSPHRSLWTPCKKSRTHGGWPALANAEVAKRYLDQLWERNVQAPWDEWDT